MRHFQVRIDGKAITVTQDDDGKFLVPDEFRGTVTINRFTDGAKPWGDAKGEKFDTVLSTQGRWPSNLILEWEAAQALDAQTGVLTSGKPAGKKKAGNNIYGQYKNEDVDVTGIGDSGGASRFFYCVQDKLDESDPVYYCGKVSPKERNAGLEDLPDKQLKAYGEFEGTPEHSPKKNIQAKNNHPTLKPIDLMKYLATLLLPPVEYAPRRIFIPFSGSGSEMIGAGLAGWEHVVGVEFDKENGYVDIAEKRLEHWLK